MINRTMVRTRVIQTLFAFYKDGSKTSLTAKKELLKSFADTYALYMQMLDFVNILTDYAEQQIEEAEQRAKITHTAYEANRRFVNNRLAQQVFNNPTIRHYLEREHMSWDAGMSAVSAIYKKLQESSAYREYMSKDSCTYEDDKRIWRKIMTEFVPGDEALLSALDELEIVLDRSNWTVDIDIVLSFVNKTLKRFEEGTDGDKALLQMFDTEDELKFGTDLLLYALNNHDEYEQLIFSHLKNWDPERIAYMDKIILQTAIAEIVNFPNIALEISLNEYIELAKEYSGEKSHQFINGILNEILLDMRRNNELVKAVNLK